MSVVLVIYDHLVSNMEQGRSEPQNTKDEYELNALLRRTWHRPLMTLTVMAIGILVFVLVSAKDMALLITLAAAFLGPLGAVWAIALTVVDKVRFLADGSVRFHKLTGAVEIRAENIISIKNAPLSPNEAVLKFTAGRLLLSKHIEGWEALVGRMRHLNPNIQLDT